MQLLTTTSAAVITSLKRVFSRHGIPETVRNDNGPQYSSQEFAEFASSYEFQHTTSSSRYPQSNGEAECMVQTVKRMLKKPQDPYMALLSYRTTPLPWCGLSPAELCMGRRMRTPIPHTNKQLIPNWPYLRTFREKNIEFKPTQKVNFDKCHRVRELPPIPDGSPVWITTENQPIEGKVYSLQQDYRDRTLWTPRQEKSIAIEVTSRSFRNKNQETTKHVLNHPLLELL